jgi:hypothetical protein
MDELSDEKKAKKRVTRELALVLPAIALTIAYLLWPDGITDLTLGQIPLGGLLRALGSVIAVIWAIVAAWTFWNE